MASTRAPVMAAGAAAANALTGPTTAPERLLTAQEVAAWLGVSARWVLAHAAGLNRPALPSVKLGKAVRFERHAVEEFIRACARFHRERQV
jgi:excisionase family DNA binding protein